MMAQQKKLFIAQTTLAEQTEKKSNPLSHRQNTFVYLIDRYAIRVCKKFYLCTLDVSQQVINYFHAKKGSVGKKKRVAKNQISEDKRRAIRDHIKSFPVVESHYCRSSTNRRYLESNLNVNKMFELYQ